MAHVHNEPRCTRCKRFIPTMPVQTRFGVQQMCFACAAVTAYGPEGTPKVETIDCVYCRGVGTVRMGWSDAEAMCGACDGKGKVTRAIKGV
jgi:hypothetical protein